MPISEGHIVPIEPGSRMHAYFYTVKGIFSCEILVTERGKEGNIYIMEVECTTELKSSREDSFIVFHVLLKDISESSQTRNF